MILNVYKPKNWTSFDVVAYIKKIINSASSTKKNKIKVGHAGTLDPLAEGVLVVLTGADTKKQDSLMLTTKEYVCEIGFGIDSPTYDLEGPLDFNDVFLSSFENKDPVVTTQLLGSFKSKVLELMQSFTGEIEQTAPPYSAKKVGGKRLYDLARKNLLDSKLLPVKTVTIYSITPVTFLHAELKNFILESGQEVLGNVGFANRKIPVFKCTISCSSGTYIRSLAHDLGEQLGCSGILLSLVRTKVGEYSVENSVNVKDLSFKEE